MKLRRNIVERYKFASHYIKGKKVLDLACGSGYGCKIIAKAGATKVVGVDISQESIEFAQKKFGMSNIVFIRRDILSYETEERYDVITSFETIEHVERYDMALQKFYSLLKPTGILIISSPNRKITSPLAKTINDSPVNRFHKREFNTSELRAGLEKQGFVVKNSDIYGQQQLLYCKNNYLNRRFKKVFKMFKVSKPSVTPVRHLTPTYCVIVAHKCCVR